MIAAIDIGNSDIVIGIYYDDQWQQQWRLPSNAAMQQGDYEIKIRQFILDAGMASAEFKGVVLSSVVPALTERIRETWSRLTGVEVFVLEPAKLKALQLKISNPHEIGSDLVANAMAAYTLYGCDAVIVDFGTALTFTTVSGAGEILGVAIAPGIRTAIKALTQNTAQLPEIELELPDTVVGKNTVHAIRSGVLYGYVGMVKEVVTRIKLEVNPDLKVVATGGLSHVLHPLKPTFDDVIPTLTLDGLRIILEKESELR
jgi:type III pantothenate kinase